MKVFAEYRGEEIFLKNYNSYAELDKDLLSFCSKEEIMSKLGLDPSIDSIYILDNNERMKDFDFSTIRTAYSFYENKKGDEFTRWLFMAACDNYHNNKKLTSFFNDRLLRFTNGKSNSSINDVQNKEGKRLHELTKKIRSYLYTYGNSTGTLREFRGIVLGSLEDYLKKNNKYDYYYMRSFALSLVKYYKYNPGKANIKMHALDLNKQREVLEEYKKSIAGYIELSKQNKRKALDEMTSEDIMPSFTYDENGIKNSEIEFLEEFKDKKNLHL